LSFVSCSRPNKKPSGFCPQDGFSAFDYNKIKQVNLSQLKGEIMQEKRGRPGQKRRNLPLFSTRQRQIRLLQLTLLRRETYLPQIIGVSPTNARFLRRQYQKLCLFPAIL
jgi:hypothetical protein